MTSSTTLKFIFNSSIALLELVPVDFQIKQKWILNMNNDIWVINWGIILAPTRQPMVILYFPQNGWILANVIT